MLKKTKKKKLTHTKFRNFIKFNLCKFHNYIKIKQYVLFKRGIL